MRFLSVARPLFAPDGKMLHHFVKNALMSILEKLSAWWWISAKSDHWSSDSCQWKCKYGTIISAASCCCWRHKLAERQSLYKAVDIKDCSQWAERFTARIIHKYKSSDEVCLIFDRYELPKCLKTATWVNRQAGQDPYINVLVIPCFSHSKTENELSSSLAENFLDHAMNTNLQVVGAWSYHCRATQQNGNHLQSDQEEADTKMLLHALDATANGAMELYIHSPDTDVSCSLRRYPALCVKTSFVFATGDNYRVIGLSPIASALGS